MTDETVNASEPTGCLLGMVSHISTRKEMEKTTEQRFNALKKLARRVTPEEQIKRGFVALEATGLDREQIEDIAQSIGLDVESFAFGVAVPPYYGTTKPVQEMTQSSRATHVAEQHDPCVPTAKPRQADGPASLHCYEPRGDSTYSVMQERIAAAIERLANHFDPPPPDIVDTHYIASRLGCTRE